MGFEITPLPSFKEEEMYLIIPKEEGRFEEYMEKWYDERVGLVKKGGDWYVKPDMNMKVLKKLADDMREKGVVVMMKVDEVLEGGISMIVNQ